MKTKCLAVFCLLMVSIPGSADESFSALVGDRAMWGSFNWKKPKTSKVWTFSGWEKVDEDYDLQSLYAKRQVDLNGVKLDAKLIRFDDPEYTVTPMERLLFTGKANSYDHCKKIEDWLVGNFGKSRIALDASYSWESAIDSKTYHHYDLQEEWYDGQTRIFLKCVGVKNPSAEGGTSNFFELEFGDKSFNVPLRPLSGLKCKYSGTKKGVKTSGEDFFFVDEIGDRIFNDKLVPFGGMVNLNIYSVGIQRQAKEPAVHVSINRRTWTYKATIGYGESQEDRSGTCTKVGSEIASEKLKTKI